MTRRRLTITIEATADERLRHIAEDAQTSMSAVVEMALEEALREPALFLARVMTHRQQNRYDKQSAEVHV